MKNRVLIVFLLICFINVTATSYSGEINPLQISTVFYLNKIRADDYSFAKISSNRAKLFKDYCEVMNRSGCEIDFEPTEVDKREYEALLSQLKVKDNELKQIKLLKLLVKQEAGKKELSFNEFKKDSKKGIKKEIVNVAKAKSYLDLIPMETDFIIKIDVSKVLAFPEVQKQIIESFEKQPNQQRTYEELKAKSGFDPLKDISSITLFSSGKGIKANETLGGALIEGNYDIEKIINVIKEDKAARNDLKIKKIDGFYSIIPNNNKDGCGMFLDNQYLVIGSNLGVNAVKSVKQLKSKSLVNNNVFKGLLNKIDSKATIIGAGFLSNSFKAMCTQNPNAATLANIDSFFFDFNNDKNMVLNFTANINNISNVNNVLNQINGYIAMIKMFASTQAPEISEVLNYLNATTNGTTINMNIDIPSTKVAEIRSKLQERANNIQGNKPVYNQPQNNNNNYKVTNNFKIQSAENGLAKEKYMFAIVKLINKEIKSGNKNIDIIVQKIISLAKDCSYEELTEEESKDFKKYCETAFKTKEEQEILVKCIIQFKETINKLEEQYKIKVYNKNQNIRVGYWSYQVYSSEWLDDRKVKGFNMFNKPSSYSYLGVRIQATNWAKSSSNLPPIKLVDSSGNEYDSANVIGGRGYGDKVLLFENVNPTLSVTGWVIFDVPQYETYRLKLSGGYWSDDSVYVNLN